MPLSESALQELREIVARYPVKKSALVPVLHLMQREYGWITPEAIEEVAEELDLNTTQVISVGTFYTMFYFQPRGKYEVQVCTSLACMMAGAEKLSEHICNKLGIKPGQTTADGMFTVIDAECLAACDKVPCIWVQGEFHEDVTPEKADEILQQYAEGRGVARYD